MTKIFMPLIDWIVEVYIDTIFVKSKTRAEYVQHLEEAFHIMRTYNMKLNLAKCAFGVNGRKFLGFMVTQRGIKINSAQVKVVIETLAPNSKKKLHRFIGCLAGLGHFIACYTNKLRHFFLKLKGASMLG